MNIGASDGKSRYDAIFITVDKPYSKQSHYGYTGALTIADSKSNGGELGSDEFFTGPDQNTFGYQHSLGVSKYRFVGTGIVDGPWETTLSGTLTLATGTPFGSAMFPANPPELAAASSTWAASISRRASPIRNWTCVSPRTSPCRTAM